MHRVEIMGVADEEGNRNRADRWLRYDNGHRVLICSAHGYAISSIHGHLSDQHPDIKSKERNAIVARYAGVEIRGAEDVKADPHHGPSNPIPAVEGLRVQGGFACRCGLLTPSWKWLRVHFNKEHPTWNVNSRERQWSLVRVQTFFTGPKRAIRYFCVTTTGDDTNTAAATPGTEAAPGTGGQGGPPGGVEDDELVAGIKERWACGQDRQEEIQKVLADGAAKHEITNWLRRSGWTAHFVGRDLGEIHASSRMPGPGEEEARRLIAATDRLFFNRCVAGLRSMPLMTRLLLASPHPKDAHSRPFGPLQEKTSMDRYVTYWKRFLCYCLRVLPLDEATLLERHGFQFTPGQRVGLEALWEHLQDEDRAEKDLEEEVLQVSAGFWMQRLAGDPFNSPLWHFIAVLGIDGESGQLRPAHLFTYVLAGLVYVGRALLSEFAIPARERGTIKDLEGRFAAVRDKWLCKATYSPMGYTLSLLLYGKKIARETGSRLMVSWNRQCDLMYFMGKPIAMDAIRSMVAEMITDAEDILWGELMFKEGHDVRFTIPLDTIEDDLTYTHRGKSFIHTNGLEGKEVEMLEDLVRSRRKGEFLDPGGEWRWEGIRKYQKSVRKFEELLVLAVQQTWGSGMARGDEIGGLRLVNGVNRDRSVFVIDGDVVLVTQYHKSLAHFDSPKVIPRIVPPRVGQLLAMYMVYVRSLTDRWEADRWAFHGQMKPPSDFIWHDENGPWEGAKISKAMAKWTHYYMGVRLTLQNWRHIAIAIGKKHTRGKQADTKGDSDDGLGLDLDEAEQYEVPDDLAAAHSTATAANYGVTADILKRLTADSLEVFGRVSRQWHKFLNLDRAPCTALIASRKRRASTAAKPEETLVRTPAKRPKPLILRRPGEYKGDMILAGLRAVLRNGDAQFRSPQQEDAIRRAAARETPLVAVLPTGSGKSLVFIVPAILAGAGVTIVVAPFAELKRQLVSRCADAGLECKQWPEAQDVWPRVTVISAEAAVGEDFLQWAADLSVRGRLDRIVIDECHLTFTAADEYRGKLRDLVLLRGLGCPFVFLTGTLPPLRQREFEEAMQLQNPLYIRASSHRLNVRYSVVRVKNGRGIAEVKKLVLSRRQDLAKGEKGVVYCASHAKCKALAQQLGCHYYHGLPSDSNAHFFAQRKEGFQAWLEGTTPYIVATAALGTGIDVPGIKHVIHLEAPYSIIDYAQEAGRAGRAGERVQAEVIVEDKDWPSEDASKDGYLEVKVREVNSLVRTRGCRRRLLGQYLDSDLRDCKALEAVMCDNCEQESRVWKSELSSQGLIMSQSYSRRAARALQRLESALEEIEELGKPGCRVCWMFKGAMEARHRWYDCAKVDESLSFRRCMMFQGKINYRKDKQAQFLSCFYCHVSQSLCTEGFKSKGASCRWKHVVMPVALAAATKESLWEQVQQLAGREFKGEEDFCGWLGRKHAKLVCGEEMTNAMAVFNLVVEWRAGQGLGQGLTASCGHGP